mmetsp:Transcript_10221/g.23327  ORF Transcript_10221/g.23327 Transcript_10221/m.23327 type:complete len:285 (-) Transcript_10221:305-1159(-)
MHPHIPHKEHGGSREPKLLSARRRPGPVRVHPPGDYSRALLHLHAQTSLHQSCPRLVHLHFVLCVNSSHRVLAVRNGGQSRFDDDVFDAGDVGLADAALAVDKDLKVQPVVAKEDTFQHISILKESDELFSVLEGILPPVVISHRKLSLGDCETLHLGIFRGLEGEDFVHPSEHLLKDLLPSLRVVLPSSESSIIFWDHICTIERVEERSPASIRSVQDEPRVVNRTDKLGPGNYRDLRINEVCCDRERLLLWNQVSDILQKFLVLVKLNRRSALMKFVNLVLD